MPDYFKWSNTGTSNSRKLTLRMIGIFAVISLVLAIPLTILFSRNPQETRQHAQTPQVPISLTPSSGTQSLQELESCVVQKKGNPLIKRLDVVDKVIIGQYEGNITALANGTNTVSLTIISRTGNQQHTFTVPINITSYDTVKNQLIDIHSLHTNQMVLISFNCSLQTNKYTITTIGKESM